MTWHISAPDMETICLSILHAKEIKSPFVEYKKQPAFGEARVG